MLSISTFLNQIIFKNPILVEVKSYLERVSSGIILGHFGSCHDGLQADSFVLKIYCKKSKLAEIKQNLGIGGGGGERSIYIYI